MQATDGLLQVPGIWIFYVGQRQGVVRAVILRSVGQDEVAFIAVQDGPPLSVGAS